MSLVSPKLQQRICDSLEDFRVQVDPLGIQTKDSFDTLARQLVDSTSRVEYFYVLRDRDIAIERSDPNSDHFDPFRAAITHQRRGDVDEAAWLTFLAIHFGKNRRTGWRLVREVYGSLGNGAKWDWPTCRTAPNKLAVWLARNGTNLKGNFGNHRKYVSLKATAKSGTGEALRTYISWVGPHASHEELFESFVAKAGREPGLLFDATFQDMLQTVKSFSRTGCFDFLCAIGKLGIAGIEPDSPYIPGSTGPRIGAELLLNNSVQKDTKPSELDETVQVLGILLRKAGVRFAMQVVEDALCNWQKSPSRYEYFRG